MSSRIKVLLGLVGLSGLSAIAYLLFTRGPTDQLDLAAAANARGLGHMEQFEERDGYNLAAAEFETAMKAAPNWTTPKVNLGIALINTQKPENLDRAIVLFQDVLQVEADHKHALYSLGIIHFYRNQLREAAPRFEAVTRLDPEDAHAWMHRGKCEPNADESATAKAYFVKALALNPYLNAARYALALHAHDRDPKRTTELLLEKTMLETANWESEYELVYSRMGKYAECIGGSPKARDAVGPLPLFQTWDKFRAILESGTIWTMPPGDNLAKAIQERFGVGSVVFDYDGDGKLDVLLPAVASRGNRLVDVLLHNDGAGNFSDVIAKMGLTGYSFGAAAADFTNDGRPDLALATAAGIRLYVNENGTSFREVTTEAGVNAVGGVFLGLRFVDLDQDGDLDLLAAKYADTDAEAMRSLKAGPPAKGGAVVWLNVGDALPGPTPGLTARFRRGDNLGPLSGTTAAVVGFVVTDVDNDRDVDVIVLRDHEAPLTILNDRLLRFRIGTPFTSAAERWQGGAVLNLSEAGASDLVLGVRDKPALVLRRTSDSAGLFESGGNPLQLDQGIVVDIDFDGRSDVIGLSERRPVLLRGTGNALKPEREPFGPMPADGLGLSVADFDNDCFPDLFLVRSTGPELIRNLGNGNKGLTLTFTGRRDGKANLRTNTDGLGVVVQALTGPTRHTQENTTLSAGLSQSRLPLRLGLGRANAADAVRIRWPDGVPQSELAVPACEPRVIEEVNRKGTSCPILHSWDGEAFAYITDFLGGGALAETGPDGAIRPARPTETLRIPDGKLKPKNGRFVVRISEPMDEVLYLDHVALEVVDVPSDREVHPDERFAIGGPTVTGNALEFAKIETPFSARDRQGRDVLPLVRAADDKRVEGFALRHWLGYSEEHIVEFDFGTTTWDVPTLLLHGWIDYPYPESIFAATQAGVPTQWPVLEQRQADGTWLKIADVGFPAGLPKTSTYPLPEFAGKSLGRLRLRSNVQIYWDRIAVGDATPIKAKAMRLPTAAVLSHPGFFQEVNTGPRGPIEYRADRTETVAATSWKGTLTKLGNVVPLVAGLDDRLVIVGPGDVIELSFAAEDVPACVPGFSRHYLLKTYGWCKDTSPFTVTGGSVKPLPYRLMPEYPTTATAYPHLADEPIWHTRPAGR